MPVDYKTEKQKIQKGSVFLTQGTVLKDIFLLNEGTLEVKRCNENIKGYSQDEILKKSKRVDIITGPTMFAIENVIGNADIKNSFIAMSDCEISRYSISNDDYINFFRSLPQIALNVIITMKENCVRNINNLKYFYTVSSELDRVMDNLELTDGIVRNTNSEILQTFNNDGGILPSKIDNAFLNGNYSSLLGKNYLDPSFDPKSKYQWKKIEFFHNLTKARPDSFIQIISTQINVFLYIYSELAEILNQISIDTGKIASRLDEKIDDFFENQYSILHKILDSANVYYKSEKIENSDFTKSFITMVRNLDNSYKKLSGKEHTSIFQKLDTFIKAKAAIQSGGTGQEVVHRKSVFRPKLANSTEIILQFTELPTSETKKIKDNLLNFNKIDFKDPTEKESRKIIKALNEDFFKLYQVIFFKALENKDNIPLPVKLFLYFGYIDEKLINDEEIDAICNSLNLFENLSNLNYPIITLPEYLTLIYNEDEAPGLSATGEEYNKYIKKSFTKVDDSPKGRVIYEIENMAKEGLRITSDNPRAYIPYLSSYSIKGNVLSVINTPKKLEMFVKKINDIDFSLFFRELTWKSNGKSELIKKEVKPYFILAPNSGIRVQLWQEIINNIRSSRARFIVPTVFNGDLEKSLIHSFALFKWELNKLIAGANWMDPVEGGFVGAFYDFSQYYHKMSELSLDAKEEIKSIFQKIKIDRERFAYYYDKWIVFEKEGIAKVNKVIRSIFYRHIPFPAVIREKLKNLPLYEDLDNRYNNISKREYRNFEARFRKYQNPDGSLPDDIQAYLDLFIR